MIKNEFKELSLISMKFPELKAILNNKTVGIAGAGGLGSNCAVALTRSGIGKLVIADFDIVEESNLNRQFYFHDQLGENKVDAIEENLLRINPDLNISTHFIKLTCNNIPDVFEHVDVLIEAFDLADQKEMLIETALEYWPERPLVVGSGMAGIGNINDLGIKKYGNLYVCGDETEEVGPNNPPLAPRVGIVAHMQADIVLSILINTCD